MKMTIREVVEKLRDIQTAKLNVNRLIDRDEAEYNDGNYKDLVLDLLDDYSEIINNIKVDI